MPDGYFITLEGPDGSGKTTQLRKLAGHLTGAGRNVVSLRQPGSTALGDRLRSVLLDSRSESSLGAIAPLAEMALMFADRAQAIAQIIAPALESGAVVLCDRFTDSSEAYQGFGRQLGSERILAMHAAVCNNLQPDLTLLLLPPLDASLTRARKRNHRTTQASGKDEGRFERESGEFYARVHAGYQHIAAREPRRILTIGEGSIDEIAAQIATAVDERLASANTTTAPRTLNPGPTT